MAPEIVYERNYKELNELLPNLLRLLEKNGIIKRNVNGIFDILSEDSFFNLGYILFLLHIGSRINHKKKAGHFYFATAKNFKEILILKNVLNSSSNFWLFYKDNPLYLQETFLFHSFFDKTYKMLINNQSNDEISNELKKLIFRFKENPQEFLKEEYEIIDIINFPIKILSSLLNTMPLDNKTDPFQLFLYVYFRTKMKVVYLEAYVKNFEEKIPWDLVAFDKNQSNKLYFVELTTGHPAKRVLKKFPSFLETIEKDGIVIYITPLKRLDKGIKPFLEYIHRHHQNNFFVIDSSFEPTIGETEIGEKARKRFNKVIEQLDSIINLTKTN